MVNYRESLKTSNVTDRSCVEGSPGAKEKKGRKLKEDGFRANKPLVGTTQQLRVFISRGFRVTLKEPQVGRWAPCRDPRGEFSHHHHHQGRASWPEARWEHSPSLLEVAWAAGSRSATPRRQLSQSAGMAGPRSVAADACPAPESSPRCAFLFPRSGVLSTLLPDSVLTGRELVFRGVTHL